MSHDYLCECPERTFRPVQPIPGNIEVVAFSSPRGPLSMEKDPVVVGSTVCDGLLSLLH